MITGLNGRSVTSLHQFEAYIFRLAPGTTVTLRIQRGTGELSFPVVTEEQSGGEFDSLADMVDPSQKRRPAAWHCRLRHHKEVLKLIPELRRPEGVVVAARKANAPYSGPLLQAGDVIYEVNRHVVNGVESLRPYLEPLEERPVRCALD